ncbi:uncharacterized protein VDAG_03140 [Verticillium dahliae VdLs.17]|uniref:Secreted protein n=1 Tax=Verticillium dahliae (strain VdLs.17 / ATCC MYA-4575 / FGSC 10137) TaxID=498257 RepID=G2WYP8_VERDV|nr:uncharacterized protein VDAG_03140 [Verticillium dahliae VdLs.17]EGY21700.1 hypothetical protein VDAG_03140 [Verticillium dahliae VdLs.17]
MISLIVGVGAMIARVGWQCTLVVARSWVREVTGSCRQGNGQCSEIVVDPGWLRCTPIVPMYLLGRGASMFRGAMRNGCALRE